MAQRLSQFLSILATDPEQLAAYLTDRDATIAAAGLDPDDADALLRGDAIAIQLRLMVNPAQFSGSVHVPPPPAKEPKASVHVPPPPTASVHVPPPPPSASVHVPPPPTASVHVPPPPTVVPPAKDDEPRPPSAERD